MKSWKRRWKDELNTIVPDMREDVKRTPISVRGEITAQSGAAVVARNRSGLIAVGAALLAFVCTLIVCLAVLLPEKQGAFFITVEINPAVSMVADEEGKVTGVIASNADADVILSSEGARENMVGKRVEEATTYYTDCAARLGYIDLLERGSAIRISARASANAENLLKRSQTALQNYFTERGVYAVVVCEAVDEEEYRIRSGITSTKGAGEIADFIALQDVLYADREAKDKSVEQLQALYRENILQNKMMSLVENTLKGNLERLKKNAVDIGNIFELYCKIYEHPDNPAVLLKDYWEVKKYYGNSLTGEFAAIVEEMDDALSNYEAEYGVAIGSIAELRRAVNSYAKISMEELTSLLENFTLELFETCVGELSEIMKITGLVSDPIIELMQLPRSAEEYFGRVHSALKAEYSNREEAYQDVYGQQREPISSADYENYLVGIRNSYGSLSNYWQAIKSD